jgi:hypothetical protein
VPRRARLLYGLAACVLLVSGCSAGRAPAPPRDPTPSQASAPTTTAAPLLRGLDVCSLVGPAQIQRVAGVSGEPSNRSLTRIPGYRALVDQCGFGVSFRSYTLLVSVGLAPASRADLARQPGRPVGGIGDAARIDDSGRYTTVSFLKGATLVQVRAYKNADGKARAGQGAAVAAEIAQKVPSDPPETDEQTDGICDRVDPSAVRAVLGGDPGLSRSFTYMRGSATGSWATGAVDARFVNVGVYTNAYAGPFLAELERSEPSAKVPGVTGGFTLPDTAYAVAADGQAVSVSGTFEPSAGPRKPLPVTPQLKALLGSAVSLLR